MEVNPKDRKHLPRLVQHMISQLVCLGRHTITNLLTTGGRQFADWTADYRLYSQERIHCQDILTQVCKEVQALNAGQKRLITALDDSLLLKTGKKIPGVKYARDPMGPPFQVNFVRGQRVIQMSAAVTEDGQSRMIPVIFNDASTPVKPSKQASQGIWERYKEDCKARRLSVLGVECIKAMRNQMDPECHLWVTVDGSYTNRTVLNNLPEKTVLIGRIRSDAKLFYLPGDKANPIQSGRKRLYGKPAPTPEEIRNAESIPWQTVQAYASGKRHEFKVKTLKYLRWRGSGQKQTLQIMIIAPLRYRLTQGSKLLYRDPAYLICTDPEIPADSLLQAYIWRWGIETNFRDEKSLLGTGQAQVRNPASVKAVPQMMVAAYSLLLLAGIKQLGFTKLPLEDIPKWQDPAKKRGASTNDLIKRLRLELWADAIASNNKNDFVVNPISQRSRFNVRVPAFSAILQVNTN
jgi:hypothetical protein